MRPSVQVKEYETEHLLNSVRIHTKTINVNCLLLKKKIPVGTRLSTPIQTGPGAHPAFYTVGTGSVSRV
jgi:hypothetical protein